MPHDYRADRQAALRADLVREGLDGLLVTHLPNIRYLTGFTGSAGLLLIRPEGALLVSDFRYATQASQEVGSAADVAIDQTNVWQRLLKMLNAHAISTLGIEGHALTVRDASRLSEATRLRIVPTTDLVERLRAVKDLNEVEAIRDAASIAHAALAEVLPMVHPGQRELDVAAALEAALRRRGSEWHPFPTIVASGPRTALPHARTSTRVIERGDWLLMDFGAQVRGYCADVTRTVVVGAPADERQRTIYELVRTAQRRAIEHLRPQMAGRDGDALAREVIAARGFGDAFGHSLGHGLGLEVHEAPRLSPTAEAPLPRHAVVTVEPGIYLPGWGGVRIEDDIYLGTDVPECLSDNRTELLELV